MFHTDKLGISVAQTGVLIRLLAHLVKAISGLFRCGMQNISSVGIELQLQRILTLAANDVVSPRGFVVALDVAEDDTPRVSAVFGLAWHTPEVYRDTPAFGYKNFLELLQNVGECKVVLVSYLEIHEPCGLRDERATLKIIKGG